MNEIIKRNINHVYYDLKDRFDDVKIVENNSFFNITATKNIDGKIFELIAEANKKHFNNNVIHWSYKTNPSDEKSSVIDRSSTLDYIGNDMLDIVVNKRFKKTYIESIKENIELISESVNDAIDESCENINNKINKILLYHDVAYFSPLNKEYSYKENINIFIKTPYKIKFNTKDKLTESTKIKLEQDILKLEYIDYVIFRNDNSVEISVTE